MIVGTSVLNRLVKGDTSDDIRAELLTRLRSAPIGWSGLNVSALTAWAPARWTEVRMVSASYTSSSWRGLGKEAKLCSGSTALVTQCPRHVGLPPDSG
jgi:hypothetical protein